MRVSDISTFPAADSSSVAVPPSSQATLKYVDTQWKIIRLGFLLLIVVSIAEITSSCVVISYSTGYFKSTIYVGIVALVISFVGLCTSTKSQDGLRIYAVLSVIGMVVSVVGTVLGAQDYLLVSDIHASASKTSSLSSSCGDYISFFQCYGDSSYYAAALHCEVAYDNTYGASATDNHCSCTTTSSSSSSPCLVLDTWDNNLCARVMDHDLLSALLANFICALLCLWLCVIVLCLSSFFLVHCRYDNSPTTNSNSNSNSNSNRNMLFDVNNVNINSNHEHGRIINIFSIHRKQ